MSYYTDLFDQIFIVACRIHNVDIRDTLVHMIIEGKNEQDTKKKSHYCDQIFLTACRINDVDTRDTILLLINKVKEHLQQCVHTETPTQEELKPVPNDTPLSEAPLNNAPKSEPREQKSRKRRS